MDPIYIPRLTHLPEQTEAIAFKEMIAELDTLTPVQGEIRVTHCGTYLQVTAVAATIVTWACDRCLQHYNHRLTIEPDEMIWLQETETDASLLFDKDLESEDLVETLSPTAHFNPTTWIYEQLCLAFPLRKLCAPDCKGIEVAVDDGAASREIDQRWAALSSLKNQMSDLN